ncbi:hypothetical protein KGQ34_02890 [Patescibacteria group bacterium]|nr:hypothetical protein [Patescibacteria group bacterium]
MNNRAMLVQLIGEYQIKQVKRDGESCFVLSSGKHTRMKYDFERLFQHISPRRQFAEAFAVMFARSSLSRFITVLVGPESTGLFLEELIQYHQPFQTKSVALAEKDGKGGFLLMASFVPRLSDRYLIVDDVLTTGRTLCGIRRALREGVGFKTGHDPDIVGGAVIVNRMPEHGALVPYVPEPLVSLLYDNEYPVYASNECPFCNHS